MLAGRTDGWPVTRCTTYSIVVVLTGPFAANIMAQGGVLASYIAINCLAPAVGEGFDASGRVVKAGRKQIFAAGELFAVHDGRSKLVATASSILVPTG